VEQFLKMIIPCKDYFIIRNSWKLAKQLPSGADTKELLGSTDSPEVKATGVFSRVEIFSNPFMLTSLNFQLIQTAPPWCKHQGLPRTCTYQQVL
jgi:hypothetical protein